jgi:hypothetical protein
MDAFLAFEPDGSRNQHPRRCDFNGAGNLHNHAYRLGVTAMHPFRAAAGKTKNIDVSSSNQSVKLWETGEATKQVRVKNSGTADAFIAFGSSTIAATTTLDMPVGPGVTEVFTVSSNNGAPLYAAAIAAGSTGKIYFTPGVGL